MSQGCLSGGPSHRLFRKPAAASFNDRIKEKRYFVVVEYILYLTFFFLNPREVKCNICLSLCNIQRLTTQNFLIKVIFKALCRASFRLFLGGLFSPNCSRIPTQYTHAHAFNLLFVQTTLKNSTTPSGNSEGREYICWGPGTGRTLWSKWTWEAAENRRNGREMGQKGEPDGWRPADK